MATSGSGTSTPIAPSLTPKTLGQVVAWVRNQLDDTVEDYLWSNDELTAFVDQLQKSLVAEVPLLVDRSTTAVMEVALTQGNGTIALSPLITHIHKAWLTGQETPLTIYSTKQMDALYPTWDMIAATADVPTILVVDGLPADTAYLYPPLAAATGTLVLRVNRMPVTDLDYVTNVNDTLELHQYAHLLIHGILWQAYLKNDADTFDQKRAEQHRIYWEGDDGNGGDKERLKQMVYRKLHGPMYNVPHYGDI